MIDCISVEAPDDVLITPSVLRESMRCKTRRQSSGDGAAAAGVKRAGSMRASHAPPGVGGAMEAGGGPPRFTRGLARTGSLRESDVTRPHFPGEQGENRLSKMTDNGWIRTHRADEENTREAVAGEQDQQPMAAQIEQSEPMGSQGRVGMGGAISSQKSSNPKYVFTVPAGDGKNAGGGGVNGMAPPSSSLIDRSKSVAENGAKHGLKHDYREVRWDFRYIYRFTL